MIQIFSVQDYKKSDLEALLNAFRKDSCTIIAICPIQGELSVIVETPDSKVAKAVNTKAAEITWMVAGKTKNSNSPMWRCLTEDGTKVNVFKHSDPEKNAAFALFEKAGYAPEMEAMEEGRTIQWFTFPIQVELTKNGEWWTVESVTPRDADAKPDAKNFKRRHPLLKESINGHRLQNREVVQARIG